METIRIQDFEFCTFGSNNYSNGMELIYAHREQLPIPISCLIDWAVRSPINNFYLSLT